MMFFTKNPTKSNRLKHKIIFILNGPNLNMLGQRDPDLYGTQTLSDIEKSCWEQVKGMPVTLHFRQTNHEGTLVDWVQEAHGFADGVIINAAAYTHTSIALYDALSILNIPVIEVHLSNIETREPFRRFSYVSSVAQRCIMGMQGQGYLLALDEILRTCL
jgi:3-dehydroquinate dehydratase-2